MGMRTRIRARTHSRENVGTTEARTSGTKVRKTRADSAFKRAAAVKRGPSAPRYPRCLIFVSTPRERRRGGGGRGDSGTTWNRRIKGVRLFGLDEPCNEPPRNKGCAAPPPCFAGSERAPWRRRRHHGPSNRPLFTTPCTPRYTYTCNQYPDAVCRSCSPTEGHGGGLKCERTYRMLP